MLTKAVKEAVELVVWETGKDQHDQELVQSKIDHAESLAIWLEEIICKISSWDGDA